MAEKEIKNAKITSVMLGGYDGYLSRLTAWIYLDYGGSGQGFGGFVLGGEHTHCFIEGVLKTLECDGWEKLAGMPCRVETSWDGVTRIGHFLKDQWFAPAEAFAALKSTPNAGAGR